MKNFITKRLKSFSYAFAGILDLFRTQGNAQVHLAALVVICMLGTWLGLSMIEWGFMFVCFALVLMAEAFNTALEYLTDLASPEIHPLAGKAKDAAAGAVLLSVIFCGVVWSIIFLPKLFLAFG